MVIGAGQAGVPLSQAFVLTHPVNGLENYEEMIRLLTEEKNAIKAYVEVNGRL